jgi:hypothetical protein
MAIMVGLILVFSGTVTDTLDCSNVKFERIGLLNVRNSLMTNYPC